MFFLSNILKKRYIIMFIMLMPSMGQAEPVHTSLSLHESIQLMLQNNRQLKAVAEHVAGMQTHVDASKSKRLPNLNLSTSWLYSNDPLQAFGTKLSQQSVTVADFAPNTLNHPAYRQNFQTRLGLSMPLFTGGALQAATSQAEAQLASSERMFEFEKQQRMYQTIALYLQTRQAREQQHVQKKSVHAAKKRWHDVQALQSKGMALASDVMHAHVYVLQRQQSLAQASNRVRNLEEQLNLMIGMNKDLEHVDLPLPHVQAPVSNLAELLQQALSMRLDLQAMQQQQQMLQAQQVQLDSRDLPQVNLVAAQTWNSTTPQLQHGNQMVGINVSMNVFDGGKDDAEQQGVIRAMSELDWKIQDKQKSIQHEVKQAYRALNLAKQQYQRQQEAAKQTQEALRIQSLRYQQGLETTSNLLEAQLASDQAELASIQSSYDAMLSQAALLLATGLLHEGAIQ